MKINTCRFKNYGLWMSILALIPMLLHAFGVKVISEEYEAISGVILSILVALGIINNPTTECKWYRDDANIDLEVTGVKNTDIDLEVTDVKK